MLAALELKVAITSVIAIIDGFNELRTYSFSNTSSNYLLNVESNKSLPVQFNFTTGHYVDDCLNKHLILMSAQDYLQFSKLFLNYLTGFWKGLPHNHNSFF